MYVLGAAVYDVTINRFLEPGSSQGTIEGTYVKSLFSRIFSVSLPYHSLLVTTVFIKIMSSFAFLRFQYFSLSFSSPSSLHRSAVYITQHTLFESSWISSSLSLYLTYVIYEDSTYFTPLPVVIDLSLLKLYYSRKYSFFNNVIAIVEIFIYFVDNYLNQFCMYREKQ